MVLCYVHFVCSLLLSLSTWLGWFSHFELSLGLRMHVLVTPRAGLQPRSEGGQGPLGGLGGRLGVSPLAYQNKRRR
ncbi:hypothetical protein BJY52DRAFT_1242296 [Lactarius psammicola]|nr:hypothetical protein BJY52DRAFT_1242296 [Lactarius psammicola]